MFMIEKGISLKTEELEIYAGENRSVEYLKKNPGGQMPALELDDGTVIAETIPICEYLEELFPQPFYSDVLLKLALFRECGYAGWSSTSLSIV